MCNKPNSPCVYTNDSLIPSLPSSPTFATQTYTPLVCQPPFKSRSNTLERTSDYPIPASKISYTNGCVYGVEEARIATEAGTRTNERATSFNRRQRSRQQRSTGKGLGRGRGIEGLEKRDDPKLRRTRRRENKKGGGSRVVGRKLGADRKSGACIFR